MSLSVQCLIVESFRFNREHMRSVYDKDVGQCLEAIGYDNENGVKAI